MGGESAVRSAQFLRGDGANELSQVPGYVVVNLNTRYAVTAHLETSAWAENVVDRDYTTFGVVNRSFFNGEDERFLGPGAPIAGCAGVRVRF